MSLSATAGAPAAPSAISFHPHAHKRGVHSEATPDSSTESGSATSGQTPATTQGLFSSLLSTLAQVAVGTNPIASVALSALTPAAPAAGTVSASTASPGTAGTTSASTAAAAAQTSSSSETTASSPSDATQSFLHSLFAALKADGLGDTGVAGSSSTPASSSTITATGPTTTAGGTGSGAAGQYEGSLTSSLQTLIQQLGSSGSAAASPTTANLSASFNNLQHSINGASAAGGAGSSNQSLTAFLSGLLQAVQSNGGHALSALGGNVNAKV